MGCLCEQLLWLLPPPRVCLLSIPVNLNGTQTQNQSMSIGSIHSKIYQGIFTMMAKTTNFTTAGPRSFKNLEFNLHEDQEYKNSKVRTELSNSIWLVP